MRTYAFTAILLPVMVAGRLFNNFAYLRDVAETTSMASASPASTPTSGLPTVTSIPSSGSIELRQAPGAAPIGDAPIQNPAPVVATVTVQAPAVEPVPAKPAPVKPAVPEPPAAPPPVSNVPFVTVQWAETFIGGTYSTWWPHTVSLDFKPAEPQAPLPGKGAIGMGTLTGKTGVTKTVAMGAAPTQGSGWMRGVVAAVGVGIAGVVV